ncbi:MAG: acyltransferase [Kiritimatiellia bacterium]
MMALAANELTLTPVSVWQATVTNQVVYLDIDNPTGSKTYSTILFAMPEIADSDDNEKDYIVSLDVKRIEGVLNISHGFKYKDLQKFYFEPGRFNLIRKSGLHQIGTRRLVYDSYDALDRFVFATESRRLKAEIAISIKRGTLKRKDKNSPAFLLCEARTDRMNIGGPIGLLLVVVGALLLNRRVRERACSQDTAPGTSSATQRVPCLDALKGLSCIAVVLLHYNLPSIYGDWLRQSLKFAVPLFFIISGFFSVSERGELQRDAILRRACGLIRIMLFVHICYMAVHSVFPAFGSSLYENRFISDIIVFILGNSSFPVLWLLGALVYCYLTIWIFCPKRVLNRYLLFIVVLTFVFTLYIQEISNVLPLTANELRVPGIATVPYRNIYLFRGFPFFMIGMLMRLNVSRIKGFAPGWLLVVISLLGGVLAVLESRYMGFAQFYLGNYITAVALICFGIVSNRRFGAWEYCGRRLSLFVYLVHYPIGMIVMEIITFYGFDRPHPIRYFSCVWVMILSLMVAYVFDALKGRGERCKG